MLFNLFTHKLSINFPSITAAGQVIQRYFKMVSDRDQYIKARFLLPTFKTLPLAQCDPCSVGGLRLGFTPFFAE